MPNYKIVISIEVETYRFVNAWGVIAASLDVAVLAGSALAHFQQAIMYNVATIKNIRVSLDPDPTRVNYVSTPVTLVGALTLDTNKMAGAEDCLFIQIIPQLGTPGRKAIRYTLLQTDVTAFGDRTIFDDTPASVTAFTTAQATLASELSDIAAVLGIGKHYHPASVGDDGPLVVQGYTGVDTHHGYFDKGTPGV